MHAWFLGGGSASCDSFSRQISTHTGQGNITARWVTVWTNRKQFTFLTLHTENGEGSLWTPQWWRGWGFNVHKGASCTLAYVFPNFNPTNWERCSSACLGDEISERNIGCTVALSWNLKHLPSPSTGLLDSKQFVHLFIHSFNWYSANILYMLISVLYDIPIKESGTK